MVYRPASPVFGWHIVTGCGVATCEVCSALSPLPALPLGMRSLIGRRPAGASMRFWLGRSSSRLHESPSQRGNGHAKIAITSHSQDRTGSLPRRRCGGAFRTEGTSASVQDIQTCLLPAPCRIDSRVRMHMYKDTHLAHIIYIASPVCEQRAQGIVRHRSYPDACCPSVRLRTFAHCSYYGVGPR